MLKKEIAGTIEKMKTKKFAWEQIAWRSVLAALSFILFPFFFDTSPEIIMDNLYPAK